MTHTFKILFLTVCCVVISMVPAAADPLSDYFNGPTVNGQVLTYTGNGTTFTDGNLQFTFTGLTINPICTAGGAQVSCSPGSYNPTSAAALSVVGTSGLGVGFDGFDLQGQVGVTSYDMGDIPVDVTEDVDLNYTVTTIDGAATITDAHLSVGACASDTPGNPPGNCLTGGGQLVPNMTVNEFFSGTNQVISASAPPNILNAMADFSSPMSSIQVTKDIFLESGACDNCSVGFSDLKQYYSQVPEPRTYAWILGLGLFGLIQLRRRFATSEPSAS